MVSPDADLSYDRPLRAVHGLGDPFPGYRPRVGYANRRFGLFAGICLQTKWQHDSGRDQVPHWFLVNQALTLATPSREGGSERPPSQAAEMIDGDVVGRSVAAVQHVHLLGSAGA